MYAPINGDADGSEPNISHSSQLFLCRPFTSDINPNYKQDQENPAPPFPVLDFHFPFEGHEDFFFNELLLHHQPLAEQAATYQAITGIGISNRVHHMDQHARVTANDHDHDHGHQQKQAPRKRTSKRDRHTKINTAQGPRDRRMRLSLEVARKFFGLQDMLRFEKPSKTIDWLLNQAKHEIKRLEKECNFQHRCSAGGKSVSSTSESEGVSGLDEVTASATNDKQAETQPSGKDRRVRRSRNTVFHPRAKEVREKARARARERTKEKNLRSQKLAQEVLRNHSEATNQKSSIVGEEPRAQCPNSIHLSLDMMSKDQERSFETKEQYELFHEQSSMTMSKWNLPFLFNSLHDAQTSQFAELQFLDKQWETYNNHNLH